MASRNWAIERPRKGVALIGAIQGENRDGASILPNDKRCAHVSKDLRKCERSSGGAGIFISSSTTPSALP